MWWSILGFWRVVNCIYCGEDWKHQYGVALPVQNEVVGSTISCTPRSSRLVSIRIPARPHDITVIQVYASTADHKDEEVEQFYEHLGSIIARTPEKEILQVQSDWNAKVGPDAYQPWAGTAGRFGFGDQHDGWWRLLEIDKYHRLTLANTPHP